MRITERFGANRFCTAGSRRIEEERAINNRGKVTRRGIPAQAIRYC